MSVTLDEIVTHQDRLRREIMERECILAAFNVLHGYVTSGRAPQSAEMGSLVALLAPSAPLLMEVESVEPAPPPALPKPPAPKPYMHPELEKIPRRHGSDTLVVQWAVRRMTSDYTLKDIEALLKREGRALGGASISVVLTRMKSRGEIEEIRRGMGPKPALFRQPATAQGEDASIQADPSLVPAQVENTESTVAAAATA